MSPSKASTGLQNRYFDAVIVPGGGLVPETGEPRPWVKARLDAALELKHRTKYYIVLSRGTTHRSPPLSKSGQPIDEAVASAKYLTENGIVDKKRILLETWSLDTIGNAAFTRSMIVEPLNCKKLCIITNDFHIKRTQSIFEWVLSMPKTENENSSVYANLFDLVFMSVPNTGLAEEELQARVKKETTSLAKLQEGTMKSVSNLAELSRFILTTHGAYSAQGCIMRWQDSPRNPAAGDQERVRNTY